MWGLPRPLTRMAWCSACLALGLALMCVLGFPALATALQQTCGDFPTQAAAQRAYRADPVRYGSLDRDRDGIACESNPCPCDREPVLVGPRSPQPAPRQLATPAPPTASPSPAPTATQPPTPTSLPSPTPIPPSSPTLLPTPPLPSELPTPVRLPPPPDLPVPPPPLELREPAWVVQVLDGATLEVLLADGTRARVRLIGIDLPAGGDAPECYAQEAAARLQALVLDQVVSLVREHGADTSARSEMDQHGQLLRYVWLADGTMLNQRLIAEGYARASPANTRFAERFAAAEAVARAAGAGLWGACAPLPGAAR